MLAEEVLGLDPELVLGGSPVDLYRYLESRYRLDVPQLHRDRAVRIATDEVDIDVTHERGRDFRTDGPHYVRGLTVTIAVPFDGDPILFHVGSRFGLRPLGTVEGQELRLAYKSANQD